MSLRRTCLFLVPCAVSACLSVLPGATASAQAPAPPRPARNVKTSDAAVDPKLFLEHVRALSSDAFEGRLPGTRGEELTVGYIADQLRQFGVRPGAADGSYIQAVPLVGVTATLSPLTLRKGSTERALTPGEDFVAWTRRAVEDTALEGSELVFVGYGVDAPEIGWDDFKGADLGGKTLVVLIGDPPVPDPADPLRLDKKTFGGTAMTYYGRWTYKMDVAAARKAAGVLIVHDTASAGYGFSVVQAQLGERFHLRTPDKNLGRPAVEGWLTQDEARALFKMAGQDFESLQRQAATRAFKPVALGVTATTTIKNTLRPIESRNVIGRIEGSDTRRRTECVVFTAHWDHFGTGPAIEGETVRHGAVDNATGVAGLLELARVFARLPVKPRRTLLFLAVTAEEQNLLGSEHYVRDPVIPLDRTLAVLNLEMMNVYGKTGDLIVYGLGESQLDDYLRDAAAEQNRTLKADPVAEQGWFFRSDHFSFAKQGVPAIWASGGEQYLDKPADFGRRVRDEFIANRYHKPGDKPRPEWDLAGAMQDLQIYVAVAFRVADADKYPQWGADSAFRMKREQMLKGPKP